MSLGRMLGFLIVLALVIGGIGYYAGWIKIGQGKVTVDGKEVDADTTMDPYTKGWNQFQLLQYKDALATYTRALRENPNHKDAATARFAVAKCYRELKQPAQAIAAYKEFVTKHPGDERVQAAQKEHDLLVQFNQ